MQKWEYCRLFVYGPRSEVWVEYYRSPQHERQRLGQTGYAREEQEDVLSRSIADLGTDGWELVSVVVSDDPKVGDAYSMYFKRPAGP